MTSASIESAFNVLFFAVNCIAVIRLLQLRLVRTYPIFFLFLSTSLPGGIVNVCFGSSSRQFFYTYLVSEFILSILYLLCVWELFSAIFRDYAGLRSLSRWVMGIAAAVAICVSGGILAVTASQPKFVKAFLFKFTSVERTEAAALVVFILILLFFISRYPITLPRNIVVHSKVYSIYFLTDAAAMLLWEVLPKQHAALVSYTLAAVQSACFLAWACRLSKAGETRETRVRRNISGEREQALIGELNALNATVLRAGRSIALSRSRER
jgi:hypothetical protein